MPKKQLTKCFVYQCTCRCTNRFFNVSMDSSISSDSSRRNHPSIIHKTKTQYLHHSYHSNSSIKASLSAKKWTDAWYINFVIMRTNLKISVQQNGHSMRFKQGSLQCFLSPTPKALMQTRTLCIIYFPCHFDENVHLS